MLSFLLLFAASAVVPALASVEETDAMVGMLLLFLCVQCFRSLQRKRKFEFLIPAKKPTMFAGRWWVAVPCPTRPMSGFAADSSRA